MTHVTAVIGAFVTVTAAFVVTLILQGEVQAFDHAKEISVAVGRHTVRTAGHKVIRFAVRVTAEFWQHIGPAFHVVQDAVVTAIIEGAVLVKFQTGKRQTCPGLIVRTFGVVSLDVIFPLAVTGEHIVNLGFAFKAETDISLVAVSTAVVGEIVQTVNFTVEI